MKDSAYLRISTLEKAYAFHVSEDWIWWNLIRYVKLEDSQNAQMEGLYRVLSRDLF